MNKYCFIIPVYNHQHKLKALVLALRKHKIPIILVDDGSNQACKDVISEIMSSHKDVIVHTLSENQGKGAAVMAGFILADNRKFTHAIQIDADFQHDVDDISVFINISNLNPKALVCGIPIYDETVPKSRLYSRYITHIWVWIHTLSTDIMDSMCGYRVYPLEPTVKLTSEVNISKRMNFDIDIIVRLKWRNLEIINQKTKVRYHDDVPSNFRLFKDNVGITLTHTKLFFGMLLRLPLLLKRKISG